MKILITGGSGFIGSNLVIRAVKEGHEVLNIDLLTYAACQDNLSSVSNNKNYNFKQIDVRDSIAITSAIKNFKPNYLMHLAAESHVDRSIDSAMDVISTNIIGTYTVIDAFTKYWIDLGAPEGYRFHHISTDEVYGSVINNEKFKEDTPYNPKNPYSASKASSDHFVRAWANTYNTPIIITNCSNNYGPFQFPEKLIPVVILKILNNEKIPVYGNGKQIRDWIHVDDHTRALLLLLEKGENGQTYNIGSNNELENIEVIYLICDYLQDKLKSKSSYRDLIHFVDDRPGHDQHYGIDSSKLINKFLWQPEYEFDKGICLTIDWYLDNKIWLHKLQKRDGVGSRLGKKYSKN